MPPEAHESRSAERLDGVTFVFGTLLGMLFGALGALWYVPLSGRRLRRKLADTVDRTAESARSQVETLSGTLTADPVAESLAEGKAAARRRRADLGLPG